MALIRKFAVQGHAVPHGYTPARGPFPPELFFQPRAVEEEQHGDSLHEAFDDIKMFRCKDCRNVLYEDELLGHDCKEDEF